MGFNHNLPVTFLFLAFIIASVLLSVFASPQRHSNNKEGPTDISCYKDNGQIPMVGDTPHPFNCNVFVTCVPAAGGGVTYIVQPCQSGHDGVLFYDFRRCMCLEQENAICYNFESEEDQRDRFQCAKELQNDVYNITNNI